MTRKNVVNKIKLGTVLVLTFICVLCMSAFALVSCGTNNQTSTDPTVTKIETDDETIGNGSFEFGSSTVTDKNFPQTSPTGWSRTSDNSSSTSSVSSGIIDTDATSWKQLMKNLCANSTFWNYVKEVYSGKSLSPTISEMEDTVKSNNPDVTDSSKITSLLKDYFVDEGYIDNVMVNPGTAENVASGETKVFMLNNFVSGDKIDATAQKVSSSTTVTMEKGSYAKISVLVNTQNIENKTEEGHGGANIRLVNKFNGINQDTFALFGIDTEGQWKNYDIYLKADSEYACTVQVVLGLGFGNGNTREKADYVKGTVFFDNVVYETISKEDYDLALKEESTFLYSNISSTKTNYFNVNDFATAHSPAYSLSLEDSIIEYTNNGYTENYINDLDLSTIATGKYTEANVLDSSLASVTSKSILGIDESSISFIGKDALVTVKNASYMVELSSPSFKVNNEEYVYVSFDIENNLSVFDTNGVSIFVKDKASKFYPVTTLTTVGETTKVGIVVKNNFPENNSLYTEEQTFSIVLFIGPKTFTSIKIADEFSTGTVSIKNAFTSTGKTYQYVREYASIDSPDYITTADITDNYSLYTLFNSSAKKVLSLYAGYSSDYASEEGQTYSFTPASNAVGTIINAPADVSSYIGVTPKSIYVREEDGDTDYTVNARSGLNGDGNGNYAGIINTAYISNYDNIGNTTKVADALNGSFEGIIQPVMIYNDTLSSYGFIGNTNISVSASSYASVSVNVRVVGNAVANIYLVNTYSSDKKVLNFSAEQNTDGYVYKETSKSVNSDLAFKVDKTTMDKFNQEWVTVTFYIATGKDAKQFRIEMWNGSRDGDTNSQGYVFFDGVSIKTSSAFTEPESWEDAFYNTSSVLFEAKNIDSSIESSYLLHQRVLDDNEIEYNKQYPDDKVSYDAKIIWAKSDVTIYAIYNTIDPVAADPFPHEETSSGCGCTTNTDPSTFWLSFSSIVLAVALIAAVIALIVKNVSRKRKANKSDAKSHYKVTSRYSAKNKAENKATNEEVEEKKEEPSEEVNENIQEDATDTEETVTEEKTEETENADEVKVDETEETVSKETEEYVYGEVTDFGEENKEESSNTETPENSSNESANGDSENGEGKTE